jgi:hypothetical protein
MKILLLLPVIAWPGLFDHSPVHFLPIPANDTAIINHVLDGSTAEWPDEKFEKDKETEIRYAVDNDKQTLFLALRIPATNTQMKIMRQGMNLYIDLKGKKKEGRGIEFPVKSEGGGFSSDAPDNRQNTDRQRVADMIAMRSSMALNLIFMKLFGFSDAEPQKQGLQIENSANILFSWDSSNVMHIEYAIPLNMLDENISSLNQKNIGIGWKIEGSELPTDNNLVQGTTTLVSVPAGSGRNSSRNPPPVSNNNPSGSTNFDKAMKEQFFWTKYTISL